MEVLILVGIGVVIWLLLRKQGLKVALVDTSASAAAPPPRASFDRGLQNARKMLARAIFNDMLVTVLCCLADAPRAKTSTIVRKVRESFAEAFETEPPPDLSLTVRSAVALYRVIVLSGIETAAWGDENPSAHELADAMEEVMERYGVLPDVDPEKVQQLVRLLVASFLADVSRAGVDALPARVQRAKEKLAAVEAEIAASAT